MISGVNVISGKASIARVSGAGWSEVCCDFLKKSLGSKEHLDCLKIDLNAAQIITVEGQKRTKN